MHHYAFSSKEASHVELEPLVTSLVDKSCHLGKVEENVFSSSCLKEENNMGSIFFQKLLKLLYGYKLQINNLCSLHGKIMKTT